MTKAKSSGLKLTNKDASVVLGMVARDDRDHDIAAWFGVNQGRIAEVKKGDYGSLVAASTTALPPKGPPGIKGRVLRASVTKALEILVNKGSTGIAEATSILSEAQKKYDANEA